MKAIKQVLISHLERVLHILPSLLITVTLISEEYKFTLCLCVNKHTLEFPCASTAVLFNQSHHLGDVMDANTREQPQGRQRWLTPLAPKLTARSLMLFLVKVPLHIWCQGHVLPVYCLCPAESGTEPSIVHLAHDGLADFYIRHSEVCSSMLITEGCREKMITIISTQRFHVHITGADIF